MSGVEFQDAAVDLDSLGRPSGFRYTLANARGQLLRAHTAIIDLYWDSSQTPFRIIHTADGWLTTGGLHNNSAAEYLVALNVLPHARSSRLVKIVVGLSLAEGPDGSVQGEDIGNNIRAIRSDREEQQAVMVKVRELKGQPVEDIARGITAAKRSARATRAEQIAMSEARAVLDRQGPDALWKLADAIAFRIP